MNHLDRFLTTVKRKTRTWNLLALGKIKRYQYWDKLLAFSFKYSSRCYTRKTPLEIEKFKNPCPNLKYFSDHFGRFSTSKSLIGVVSNDHNDIIITQHLLKLVYQTVKSAVVSELATAEILAKVLAYRNLSENDEIWIPTRVDEDRIDYVLFKIDTIFDLWKKHAAFGLIPQDRGDIPPLLLFRGTDFSILSPQGRASIISDLDPDGPGRRLFYNSRSDIKQWLQQVSHFGQKARVIGHSLGGVLASYTVLYEYECVSKNPLYPSYAFNSPGVSPDLVDEWNEIPVSERPAFSTFVTRGDIVSKFGKLFGDCYELFTNTPLSPMIAHEQLIFSQPLCYSSKIDNEKENLTKSRQYYSVIQKQSTCWAYRFGLKFLFPNPFKDVLD